MFIKRIIRRIKFFPRFVLEAKRWEYESCQKCGSCFRIAWKVRDDIWQTVTGKNNGGSYCVDCFIKLAETKDIVIKKSDIKLDLFYGDDDK